jgi:hypothetical protein
MSLYENRESLGNPLDDIEDVYEYFDHPLEIRGLIRYMPAEGEYRPQDHSVARKRGADAPYLERLSRFRSASKYEKEAFAVQRKIGKELMDSGSKGCEPCRR